MKRVLQFVAAVGMLGACALAGAAGPGGDPEATARTLVNQCANIKQGDLVMITGKPTDMDLLECVAVNVRKIGAFPMICVTTEHLQRRCFDEVPAKFDSQVDQFDVKLAGIVNAVISVGSTENPTLFADASADRMATIAKARMESEQAFLKHDVRNVSLGNGLYPTEATARMYGLSKDQLSEIFWSGVNCDYSTLQYTGEGVKKRLVTSKECRITNPNGTDITFKIDNRPVYVSDGVISAEDVNKGGPACQVWLPAGEVYCAPVSGTCEGKLVIERFVFHGKDVKDITCTFKNGKCTSLTGGEGFSALKEYYDKCGTGKDEFGFFDIGINQAVKAPTGTTKFQSWIPAGMVTVGMGSNIWAGGKNECEFDLIGFLPGCTFTCDGKPLIERGVLKY